MPTTDTLSTRAGRSGNGKRRIVATYDYRDGTGDMLFQVVRFAPKNFRQRRPTSGEGWKWSVKGVRQVPYRLPELLAEPDETVFVVEGEKDVDKLGGLGVLATCNAGGAGKWKAAHAEFLRSRRVVVLPDNDERGRKHAEQVSQSLQGIAKSVRIVELPGLPDKGDASDWIAAGGTKDELERLAEAAPDWTATSATEPIGTERDRIEVTPDEHLVIEAAVNALAKDERMFVRGGVLVQLVDCRGREAGIDRKGNLPHLRPIDVPNVREALSRQVYFFKMVETNDGGVECQQHPPGWCCSAVATRGNWPAIRTVSGITTVPVLRPDGTILDSPGFDSASGLLYVANEIVPEIVGCPSEDDAKKAAARLLELVTDFPFASDEHRSAWLAALLTPLARYAFDGPAPLFLFDANTRGSGKTLLTDLIGEVVSGRNLPRMTCPRDDDESRKRITALAIAGDPMILLDNIPGALGSASLDAALTGTEWEDRRLGKSEMVRMPLMAVWYATGNNVAIHADTSRRIILVRLESPDECPEERSGFLYPDLMAHLRERRTEYLADALTCLRGFFVAGKPKSNGEPFGSFEGWSRIVRDCVCWLGLPDPAATRRELISRNDRSSDILAGLVNGLAESDREGEGLTSAEIVKLVEMGDSENETLRAAVLDACDASGMKVSTRKLGNLLARIRGRVFNGRAIDCRKPGGTARWFVRAAVSQRAETEQQEQQEQQQNGLGPTLGDDECCSSGSSGSDSRPEKTDDGENRMRVTI